jgi:Zn-dependent protease with chaperone function
MRPTRRPWPLAALCALVALGASAQQDTDPGGQRPAASTGATSLSDTLRGLRDKVKGAKGKTADPEASAAAASAPEDRPAGAKASAGESTVKIKEFPPGSKLPTDWNDTHCKNLVEPFGITDSALSLAKLKAEIEGRSLVNRITGKSGGDTREAIRKAARQLNWMPMPVEVKLGQQLHENQTSHLLGETRSGKEAYARARRVLGDVLGQVKEAHPYNFQIFVVTASGGNAESGPGGFIYVDRDLVSKASEEPRARFTIAHEVSHVLQRHRTRETQMRLSDGIDSVEDLAKLMGSPQAGIDSMAKKGVDLKRLFVRHSEDQELQADGCSVRLLDAMSRDKAELAQSLSAFVQGLPPAVPEPPKADANNATFTELSDLQVSRHPSTDRRIKNLNAVLADLRAGK